MTALRRLWAEVSAPEDGRPYVWATIFLGHAVLGLGLGQALGAEAAGIRALIAFLYWLAKERGDLSRGGSLRDGLIDAAAVWAGAYMAERWVSVMVLITAAAGAWIKEARASS